MRPLVQLKQDRDFNSDLGEIIEVLKIAASVQLRQLQSRARPSEEFRRSLEAVLDLLGRQEPPHPLLADRADLPSCIVVITSDEGFTGGLNDLVVTAALEARNAARGDGLVVLGERGATYLEELNESFLSLPGVSEDLDREPVEQLKRHVMQEYRSGRCGRLLVVYARLLSATSQRVERQPLLPYRVGQEPAAGRQASLVEPSADHVIEGAVDLWLDGMLHQIFQQSKLAECSARLMHLEGSDQELARLNQQLALQYVKHLHVRADTTIREISAARLKERHTSHG